MVRNNSFLPDWEKGGSIYVDLRDGEKVASRVELGDGDTRAIASYSVSSAA